MTIYSIALLWIEQHSCSLFHAFISNFIFNHLSLFSYTLLNLSLLPSSISCSYSSFMHLPIPWPYILTPPIHIHFFFSCWCNPYISHVTLKQQVSCCCPSIIIQPFSTSGSNSHVSLLCLHSVAEPCLVSYLTTLPVLVPWKKATRKLCKVVGIRNDILP